jgi:hypothetical protein
MITQTKIVEVQPDSKLDDLLDQADKAPLRIERNGVQYLVTRDPDDPFAYYDPKRALEGLEKSRGALKGVDIEKLKADLREQRG